jgi:hypothetical protein
LPKEMALADSSIAAVLTAVLTQLDPTAKDKHQAHQALLAAELTQENRQARQVMLTLLASQPVHWGAEGLAAELTRLDPTAEDKRQARQMLLALPPDWTDAKTGAQLAGWVIQLDPTAEDKCQARDALLELLAWARAALDDRCGGGPRKPSHTTATASRRHWRATASERRKCRILQCRA